MASWKLGPVKTDTSIHEQTALGWSLADKPHHRLTHLVGDDRDRAVCSDLHLGTQFLGILDKVTCPNCQAWIAAKFLQEQDDER